MKKIFFRQMAVKSFLLCALFFTSAFQLVNAQTNILKGVVFSDDGQPLPEASIVVTGSSKGVVTDFDGNFTISVPADAKTISVSYLGFKTQLVAYLGQQTIKVVLKSDDNLLEEVVVVGYGTQKIKDVTGSISQVKAADVEKTTNTTIEEALAGRVAGLNTISTDGTPGAGMRIRIRGGTSINASNEPLYVIDGIPIEADYGIANGPEDDMSATESSPLANLDPSNIESIEVLKDASAAAIYGSRGANGVIIITTKRGKIGKSTISVEASTSVSAVPKNRFVNLMDVSEWGAWHIKRKYYNIGGFNDGVWNWGNETIVDPLTSDGIIEKLPSEWQADFDAMGSTDWQKEYYRVGIIQKYAIGFSGGDEGMLYNIRGSYLENGGAIRNSTFKRYNLNVNLKNTISDKFSIKTVLSPSFVKKRGPSTGGNFNQRNMGAVLRVFTRRPDRGPGVFEDDEVENGGIWVDPITQDQINKNDNNTTDFLGNTLLTYEVVPNLKASVRIGGRMQDGKAERYFSKKFGRGNRENGVGTKYHYQILGWNNQNMLTYSNNFGKHRLTALAAFTQNYTEKENEYMYSTNFEIETLGFDALQFGLEPRPTVTTTQINVLKSYLGRINYGFSNKYNLTLSLRADGTSKFIQNKWGYFPAAAFSWNVSREKFLKKSKTISNLKLRLSYGQTGNQGIPTYGPYAELDPSNYVLNDLTVAGVSTSQLENPDLVWEFTDQYDAGIDLGLFDGRIKLSVDAYYKRTEDMLLKQPIPMSSGFSSRLTNIGNLENKGLEFTLNTINVDKDDFQWTTNFTLSSNRNKVLSLGGVDQQLFGDQFTSNQQTGIMRVGESLGGWYGYETNGVFTYDDFQSDSDGNPIYENGYPVLNEDSEYLPGSLRRTTTIPAFYGDLKYKDQNGDGVINDEDKVIIANTQPKFFGGLFNEFSIGRFNLGLFLTFKYDFDVINGNPYSLNRLGPNNNRFDYLNDAWTPENSDTNQIRADYTDQAFNSTYVEDGSYIRLQSVNLSYNLPTDLAAKIGMQSLKLFTNIDNLAIWTKYSGYDPEVSVASGQRSITSANLDYGAYPRTTNISMGVRLGF